MKKECLYLLTFHLLAKLCSSSPRQIIASDSNELIVLFPALFSLFFLALGSKSKMIVTKYVP